MDSEASLCALTMKLKKTQMAEFWQDWKKNKVDRIEFENVESFKHYVRKRDLVSVSVMAMVVKLWLNIYFRMNSVEFRPAQPGQQQLVFCFVVLSILCLVYFSPHNRPPMPTVWPFCCFCILLTECEGTLKWILNSWLNDAKKNCNGFLSYICIEQHLGEGRGERGMCFYYMHHLIQSFMHWHIWGHPYTSVPVHPMFQWLPIGVFFKLSLKPKSIWLDLIQV